MLFTCTSSLLHNTPQPGAMKNLLCDARTLFPPSPTPVTQYNYLIKFIFQEKVFNLYLYINSLFHV